MDNENKNIFTPSSAASLDRLRERRNTASTGDDTGGEAVSAAQSGPENGQSRIPKILKPEARAAQRAESGEAPNETDPAASDAVRQTVQNGVGGEPTCAPQQTAQSAARRIMPGNIRQASTGGARQPMTEPKRSETANRVRQADRAASPRQSLQPDAAKARRNITQPGTARGQQNPARTGAGRASRDSAQSVGVPRPRTQPMGAVPSDKSNGSGIRAVDVSDLRKRKSGFFRGLRIYIIIALAVIAVGLGVFYAFMSAFEYTRPENRIKDYFSSLDGSAVYSLISERRGAPLAESCTQTVEKFIETYVTYTAAGYTDGTMAKFVATRSLTWQGSEAYEDITASRFSFAQNIPCTVKSLDITAYDFFSHGADMFSCKVDFTAEMKNFGQKTDTVKGAELVFARSGADFLLVRMRLS